MNNSRPRRRSAAAGASPVKASASLAGTRWNSPLPGWQRNGEGQRSAASRHRRSGAGRLDDGTGSRARRSPRPRPRRATRADGTERRLVTNVPPRIASVGRGGNSRRRSASLGSTGGLTTCGPNNVSGGWGSDGNPSDGNPASPPVSAGRATSGGGPSPGQSPDRSGVPFLRVGGCSTISPTADQMGNLVQSYNQEKVACWILTGILYDAKLLRSLPR